MAYSNNRTRAFRSNSASKRAAMARYAQNRRLRAGEIDPDAEKMVDEFGDVEINEDGREIEERSGEGEVSDDLIEPVEVPADSKAPVQDSVTARRLRRFAEDSESDVANENAEPEEEDTDSYKEKIEARKAYLKRKARMNRKKAMMEQRRKMAKRRVAMRRRAESEKADDKAEKIIEDEVKRDEDVLDKVTEAARLAELQKQHGIVPAKASTMTIAKKIAKNHTSKEIAYAVANLNCINKQRKASKKVVRREAAKPKTSLASYRKASAGQDSINDSVLFL